MSPLAESFKNMGMAKLAALGGVAALAFGIIISLSSGGGSGSNANKGYAPLYVNLSPTDGAKIIQTLEGMNVPYDVRANGTQVYVPSDQIPLLKMKMAGEGISINGNSVGYEIFDNEKGMGQSNFVYNVNLLRATEGELARTISSFAHVDSARVHLVMPKKELFSREQLEPSASVVLKVRGGVVPKQEVESIRSLVAGAVPGLKSSKVTIADNKGRLLARGSDGADSVEYANSVADDYKVALESRLRNTVEDILERSVGLGRVKAQVAADIDFDRKVTNSETYDPEGQVARSVQTTEEKGQSSEKNKDGEVSVQNNLPEAGAGAEQAGSATANQKNDEVTNFEISKTTTSHVQEGGRLKRLSVAVLVDGVYTPDEKDKEKQTYAPRSDEDLKKLEGLVKTAIGYDEKRGDKVEIVNMQFTFAPEELVRESKLDWIKQDMGNIIETLVIALVAILAIFVVIKPLVGRVLEITKPKLDPFSPEQLALEGPHIAGHISSQFGGGGRIGAGGGGDDAFHENEDTLIDMDNVKGKIRSSTMKKVVDIVDKNSDETISTLRRWIKQESEA